MESISSPGIGESVTELFGFHCFLFLLLLSLLGCASPIKLPKIGRRSNILNHGIEIFENLLQIALARRTKRFTLFNARSITCAGSDFISQW